MTSLILHDYISIGYHDFASAIVARSSCFSCNSSNLFSSVKRYGLEIWLLCLLNNTSGFRRKDSLIWFKSIFKIDFKAQFLAKILFGCLF